MDKNKIEIKDLYLIFGSERNKAFKMLKKGKSKSELLKETGCTVAVNNASLSVREGEIFVIMGLSGSGKSSLLRCINRLNRPTSGEILINGEDIAGVPDERLRSLRRKELAMVFQHFGLMPHYTVLCRTSLSDSSFKARKRGNASKRRRKACVWSGWTDTPT